MFVCLVAYFASSSAHSLQKLALCAVTWPRCVLYWRLLSFNLLFGTSGLFVLGAWVICRPDRLSLKMGFFAPDWPSTDPRAEKTANSSAWKTEFLSPSLQAHC